MSYVGNNNTFVFLSPQICSQTSSNFANSFAKMGADEKIRISLDFIRYIVVR